MAYWRLFYHFVWTTKDREPLLTPDIEAAKRPFEWQEGYGVFSVSEADVPHVIEYVRSQKLHHAARTLVDDWEQVDTLNLGPSEEANKRWSSAWDTEGWKILASQKLAPEGASQLIVGQFHCLERTIP